VSQQQQPNNQPGNFAGYSSGKKGKTIKNQLAIVSQQQQSNNQPRKI